MNYRSSCYILNLIVFNFGFLFKASADLRNREMTEIVKIQQMQRFKKNGNIFIIVNQMNICKASFENQTYHSLSRFKLRLRFTVPLKFYQVTFSFIKLHFVLSSYI